MMITIKCSKQDYLITCGIEELTTKVDENGIRILYHNVDRGYIEKIVGMTGKQFLNHFGYKVEETNEEKAI